MIRAWSLLALLVLTLRRRFAAASHAVGERDPQSLQPAFALRDADVVTTFDPVENELLVCNWGAAAIQSAVELCPVFVVASDLLMGGPTSVRFVRGRVLSFAGPPPNGTLFAVVAFSDFSQSNMLLGESVGFAQGRWKLGQAVSAPVGTPKSSAFVLTISNSSRLFVNGEQQVFVGSAAEAPAEFASVGPRFAGDVITFFSFNDVLSCAERAGVEDFFARMYSIPISDGAAHCPTPVPADPTPFPTHVTADVTTTAGGFGGDMNSAATSSSTPSTVTSPMQAPGPMPAPIVSSRVLVPSKTQGTRSSPQSLASVTSEEPALPLLAVLLGSFGCILAVMVGFCVVWLRMRGQRRRRRPLNDGGVDAPDSTTSRKSIRSSQSVAAASTSSSARRHSRAASRRASAAIGVGMGEMRPSPPGASVATTVVGRRRSRASISTSNYAKIPASFGVVNYSSLGAASLTDDSSDYARVPADVQIPRVIGKNE